MVSRVDDESFAFVPELVVQTSPLAFADHTDAASWLP